MKTTRLFYLCLLIFCVQIVGNLFEGCSTNQSTIAYKSEVAGDLAVKTAMTGWGFYVANYHPGTNAELRVLHGFNVVKAAELTVVDATASLAANPTNTAPLVSAQNALAASQASLVTLISSLTNTIPKIP